MAHSIEVRFKRPVGDEHKTRNFIEALCVWVADRGYGAWDDLDKRVNAMEDISFSFPARRSHEVTKFVTSLVDAHFMGAAVDVTHLKKAALDG